MQASQMKITKESIKKAKQHPMSLEAPNILIQEAYSDFYTQCMDCINHNVTIQLDGSILILRVDLERKPHLFRNKTNGCMCKETTGYSRQRVLLSRFETSYYNNRWFFCVIVTCCRDVGNYKNPTISQQITSNL